MVRLPTSPESALLPLENGDRLSCQEFERRYQAMPELKKAELIEGVVYVSSPVRVRSHGWPHTHIITWLGSYEAATPGTMVCDNTTVRLDANNEPQPDALLRIDETLGGQSRISNDDYIEGSPELIVEIAASSASYDLYEKKQAYGRNGVQEYLIWQVADRRISWFSLQSDGYVLQSPNQQGILFSTTFPGLWLNVEALLSRNLSQVLSILQEGIQSAQHKAFIERLSREEKTP
ncbi:MAG: Uma2 family endonuclease [Thermostichus sp. BF3_bins_97]